jgi:Fe-S-cluster containining protein
MNVNRQTDMEAGQLSVRAFPEAGIGVPSATTAPRIAAAQRESAITLGLAELERQLERANIFGHSALGESFLRLGELEALVHGLTDALLAKGVVAEADISAAVANVRRQLTERGELNGARTMVRVDQPVADPPTKVDCQARLPICHAVCCKLDFALSVTELESGKIKWDLGRPYFIRHDHHGACVHLDPISGGCRIYADRPGVCQRYSCAHDSRIWKDFEKMELNHEWIDANLSAGTEPRVLRALMHAPERLIETKDLEPPTAKKEYVS